MTTLFTTDDLATVSLVLVEDAGHLGCGGWYVDTGAPDLVCACGQVLFRLERRENADD